MLNVYCLHGGYGPRQEIPYGCTYIRLLLPLTHPSLEGRVRMRHGLAPPVEDVDVVIVERHWREDTRVADVEALLDDLRLRRIPLLHTIDDNLLDLHADEPWCTFPTPKTRSVVTLLARESDGIIVSTPALRERLLRLNPRIAVVPNALDERLFFEGSPARPARPMEPGVLTIGCMGTLTHESDVMMVLRALREVLHDHAGKLRVELVGLTEDGNLMEHFKGLPVTALDPGPAHVYTRFPGWMRQNLCWDLAIAPLEETPLNACKSDIKFLDYAALGIAAVLSDVAAYRGSVVHRETGYLCPNEPTRWREGLEETIGDARLRDRLARNARAYVQGQRTLKQSAGDWVTAIEGLIAGR
jgi:glycosyltransferase involved in cell wall biosynthesis